MLELTPANTLPPQMGAGVVTALLDYWDPEGYGMADLNAELDFMHPVGAEARRFTTVRGGGGRGGGGVRRRWE